MPTNYHIEYIRREAIDTSQWDQCIEESANSLIYAHSFYLDNMAKNWDALILNNYEAIMPLTWNQKWGTKYLYQPPLTQQLGIFSRKSIGDEVRKAFINEATKHFRFAEIYFNYFNSDPGCKPCNNYILSLNTNYEALQNAYAADLIKNLKRSSRFELHYRKENELTLALKLHEEYYKARTPHVQEKDYENFERVTRHLFLHDQLLLRSIYDNKNQLLAIALLMKDLRRIYLIESTTTQLGRDMQANHFLMDSIIREFAGRDLILDFVGSDIPGISHFYKNFGTTNQPYFFFRFNKLPWPLKLLK